ncbi:MBL fold metallo-hydrolase [Paraburkholderia caribensis]|uniref:MBL fold metallo-hydrolase n=1 Tax=Paraburkholderia caribensis TaxID=75105 RepID=UPI001CAB6579|nr:MBL fold metallo-hydrolase [Paraburkholderia caribensis]GJH34983.1 MBL fold metallo-hydrolase [Paraburkholderia hospita]CAG9251414.1 Glyoxylase, beta-lactamase superfamily II [Paraburkholderia caribensis]
MNTLIKPGNKGSMLSTLFVLLAIAAGSSLASTAAFAETGSPPSPGSNAGPDDYFHTGAGARYLRRADGEIVVQPLRGNITVLMGSGGNITVLSGKDGKFLVDAGISKSQDKLQAALYKIGPSPLKYVVNTHWHWDHTDGNAWMHAAGATIVAHKNTLKHLTETTHVNAWNWTFDPVPAGARPTLIVDNEKTFNFAGTTIEVQNFGGGHTDGDLWVYFKKADVLALGDTFWNGIYPYIDNEDGGNIDGAIKWANKAVASTTDHTIVVPGHGAVGTRTQLIEFRDMLVTVRNNVAALKSQGKSLDEIIAARPTAAFDAKWGNFVFNGSQFTKMVYDGL